MDGALLFSPIDIHFWITVLLAMVILVIYAIHARLLVKLWHWIYNLAVTVCAKISKKEAKKKPAVESRFRMTVLLRWMLLPSVISVALIFFFLSLNQNPTYDQHIPSQSVSAAESIEAAKTENAAAYETSTIMANALVKIAQVFSMEITVEEVWELYAGANKDAKIPAVPPPWVVFWISFVMAAAPLLTIITAASFFRVPRFWAAMLIPLPFFGKRFYVFSELNEHSRKYALCLNKKFSSSLYGKQKTIRPYIIFCCDEKTADESTEMGRVLLMKRSITNLHILGKWRFNFYLISDNETLNVEQAAILKKKYQRRRARIFCVSNGLVSEHAVDNLNKNILTLPWNKKRCHAIELIDEKLRVVYQDLYENPLLTKEFLKKVDETNQGNSTKQIRILVLGTGRIGELVTRTMMWYCQLPDHNVHITVADQVEKKVIEHRIFRHNISPEDLKELDIFKSRVQIDILEKINLLTDDLENLLSGPKDGLPVFHAVYVCLGEDNRNYQAALKVRQFYLRTSPAWGCPEIRTVIWDDTITELVEDSIQMKGNTLLPGEKKYTNYYLQGGKTFVKDDPDNRMCPVHLLGSMKKTLLDFEALKTDAFRYHTFYCNPDLTDTQQEQLCIALPRKYRKWVSLFDKEHLGYQLSSQSDVRSNHAVALHGYVKLQWLQHLGKNHKEDGTKNIMAESEHIRWSIFKLMEGYCPIPSEDLVFQYLLENPKGSDEDTIRGYHVCLASWKKFNDWSSEGLTIPAVCNEQWQTRVPFLHMLWKNHNDQLGKQLKEGLNEQKENADRELQQAAYRHFIKKYNQLTKQIDSLWKKLLKEYKANPTKIASTQWNKCTIDAPALFGYYTAQWTKFINQFMDVHNAQDLAVYSVLAQHLSSLKKHCQKDASQQFATFFIDFWNKQKETDANLASFSILLEDNKLKKPGPAI